MTVEFLDEKIKYYQEQRQQALVAAERFTGAIIMLEELRRELIAPKQQVNGVDQTA